jgi:uncharacterized membrane protein YagU involved in acid resistance
MARVDALVFLIAISERSLIMTHSHVHTHNQRKPYMPDWPAAIYSGLIAGAIFMMLEMIMVPLFLGGSAWGPPRMIAAIVMGREVLPPPATFDFAIVMVAMIVHFVLSLIYAVAYDWATERLNLGATVALGAVFGLLLYVVNFYGFTAIFPWFAGARNWVSIFAHVVFGISVAVAYKQLERYRARPSAQT